MNMEGKINAVYFEDFFRKRRDTRTQFVPVDLWQPTSYDEVIVNCKPGFFIAPLGVMFDLSLESGDKLDYFILSTKKCYNSAAMRNHLFTYINYFCNYYDPDYEYLCVLYEMKVKTDRYDTSAYPPQSLFYDCERYIVKSGIADKVQRMVMDNYYQDLNYSNIKNPSLQYTNDHARILHKMSILMDLSIPILTNYAYMHKIDNIDEFLLAFYDKILHMDPNINIYAKLYDTAFTNVIANQKSNPIWAKQDIRSIDASTHSVDSVHNIILNIMPKYSFDKNIISFNYASIRRNTSYKITDISFEFSYIPISSSKRDNDSISDFDKFESNLIRSNEGLYLQNKINGEYCMKTIETIFGPFSEEEMYHYERIIRDDTTGEYTINSFQRQLIFNLFYRFFRDTQSVYSINRMDYLKLAISAKKKLLSSGMIILPYIISGKVEKLVQRKSVNKKEKAMVESSPSFHLIVEKYRDENVVNRILSILATIISSEFSIVDMDPSIDGRRLDISSVGVGVIVEEVENYVLMC